VHATSAFAVAETAAAAEAAPLPFVNADAVYRNAQKAAQSTNNARAFFDPALQPLCRLNDECAAAVPGPLGIFALWAGPDLAFSRGHARSVAL
jgi:hypothetical protein